MRCKMSAWSKHLQSRVGVHYTNDISEITKATTHVYLCFKLTDSCKYNKSNIIYCKVGCYGTHMPMNHWLLEHNREIIEHTTSKKSFTGFNIRNGLIGNNYIISLCILRHDLMGINNTAINFIYINHYIFEIFIRR